MSLITHHATLMAVVHLMQVIDAVDPVCDTLAILASVLHSCNLSCGATACTCLRIPEAAHTGEPID